MKSLHEDEVKGLRFTAFEEEKLFCFFFPILIMVNLFKTVRKIPLSTM